MKIPLFKIYWDKEDVKAVSDVIKSGMNWAIGPKIEELERAMAEYVGAKYALTFSSGTSALHSLMIAYGFGAGDEVIVPSFTFIATANASLFVGANPVFADIEEETFGLDPKDVEKKITKRTKAIIAVHYSGLPCKIKEIKKIAQKYNLILIEDAAESLGARINKKKAGTFGDAAMFSFCGPKVITTGEGGAIVTNNRDIYEKLKLIRSHGRVETANYFNSSDAMQYVQLGYNFRMSNITAALGLSQLKKIEKVIKMRRSNADYLSEKLLNVKEIVLPTSPEDYFNVFQMYTIRVKKGREARDRLKKHLNGRGVAAKIYFEPVHLAKFYKMLLNDNVELGNTQKISSEVLTLPMYPSLSKKEIDYIAGQINIFFRYGFKR